MNAAAPSWTDVLRVDGSQSLLGTLDTVWQTFEDARRAGAPAFSAAVRTAARTDRLGFAFAVGYPAALEHMVPGVTFPTALCVTEADGNAPRAIQTTLTSASDGLVLEGTKTFVTFGDLAATLLVAARVGQREDGRPDLAVVRIPASRRGVDLQTLPQTPFVPEVPHTAVRFDSVEVDPSEVLSGDGYLGYVKPFRTIEDIHVIGATLAYLIGLFGRVGAPIGVVAKLAADLVALDGLASKSPLDPSVHVALHGVIERLTEFVESPAMASVLEDVDADERRRWERDRPLLKIANKARTARFAKATEALGRAAH